MPEFYHDLITEKSFKILQKLKGKLNFILIGGWAVFVYAKNLKSKDIDIIVDYDQLETLRKEFEIFKNERLKKYEIKNEDIDIDIYLPHFSEIGIPVEDIISDYSRNIEGFSAPTPEVLLILKLYAFSSRQSSNKGKKDLIDIFSLLSIDMIDWKRYRDIIKKYNFQELNQGLIKMVSSQRAVPELNLSNHKIARLRKSILKSLERDKNA
ncbi:MAG: hypothetical protein COT37_01365 [Parcubacteria group bacterium CG08_land_8_20_14_0_20_43_9]|nr:MAG: hypothetical protein COT37_01365 [Parcubacteria group bacterium CG08_land_8_20_14_0_20_43_9]